MAFKQRKGAILITALIIIAVCTTAALYLHESAMSSFASVVKLQTEYQGAIYAMTVSEAVDLLFKYDDANYDGVNDIWNTSIPIPVEKGFLTIYVKPLNSKFPINALANDNETERERYEQAFDVLMSDLEIDNYDLDELLSWLGSGYPSVDRYDENNGPYSMKGAAIDTLAELAYVPSFANIYRELSQYVSIGGVDYKINMNLADEDLIVAILPELTPYIADIISAREDEEFKNVSDIYQAMGGVAQDVYSSILPFVDVKTTLYYAKIELNVNDENTYYHVLYSRSGSSARAIKYIEGGSIDYF